jgi:hypothetical protein
VVPTAGPLTSELDGIRLIKSHQFDELYRPMVYLVRDGRNAMLSNLMLKFLAGGHRLSSRTEVLAGLRLLSDEDEFWGDHAGTALALAEQQRACFVRYEDLLADPRAALSSVFEFIGIVPPDDILSECVRLGAESQAYFARGSSGYTYRAEPGSIYETLQAHRRGEYWRELFDAGARRYFHERGGTEPLLRFGYEESPAWWRD